MPPRLNSLVANGFEELPSPAGESFCNPFEFSLFFWYERFVIRTDAKVFSQLYFTIMWWHRHFAISRPVSTFFPGREPRKSLLFFHIFVLHPMQRNLLNQCSTLPRFLFALLNICIIICMQSEYENRMARRKAEVQFAKTWP